MPGLHWRSLMSVQSPRDIIIILFYISLCTTEITIYQFSLILVFIVTHLGNLYLNESPLIRIYVFSVMITVCIVLSLLFSTSRILINKGFPWIVPPSVFGVQLLLRLTHLWRYVIKIILRFYISNLVFIYLSTDWPFLFFRKSFI